MGMSASQARLLSLTSRQHDLEYKAQRLEAQKLQMSFDSDDVYNKYLDAVDATKIQTKVSNVWDDDNFADATLNMLENQNIATYTEQTAKKQLFLEEISSGKLLITPEFAKKYEIEDTKIPDQDRFLVLRGHQKTTYPVYTTKVVPDETRVASFKPVTTDSLVKPVISYDYTKAVKNIDGGGIDYSALSTYASFDSNHSTDVSLLTDFSTISRVSDVSANTTYKILNKAGLENLLNMCNSTTSPLDTSGLKFVLADNITMTSSDWAGIGTAANAFKGTFDGNGYSIINLSGTQGLFGTTNGATVQNVKLENENIVANTTYLGGLIGYAEDTNINNVSVSGSVTNTNDKTDQNTYSVGTNSDISTGTGGLVGGTMLSSGAEVTYSNLSADTTVTAKASDCVGGLFGATSMNFKNTVFDLKNAYSIGDVSGRNCVGGIAGHMYYDEDSYIGSSSATDTHDPTDIVNIYSGSDVSGNHQVGGAIGDFVYWGDNGDMCYIRNSQSVGSVNGSDETTEGAFIGEVHIKNAANNDNYKVHIDNSGYASNTGAADGFGAVVDNSNNDVKTIYLSNSGSAGTLTEFMTHPKIPSINADGTGGLYSNIYALMVKSGSFDSDNATTSQKSAFQDKIKAFLSTYPDDAENNAKLFNMNEKITTALADTTLTEDDKSLVDALVAAINNDTSLMSDVEKGTATASSGVARSTDSDSWDVDSTLKYTEGTLSIPSIKTLSKEMSLAFNKVFNSDISSADIEKYLNAQYADTTTDTAGIINKSYLAKIQEIINNNAAIDSTDETDLLKLYNAYQGNTKFTEPIDSDIVNHPNRYTISMSDVDASTELENSVEHPTKIVKEQTGTEDRWDMTDDTIIADIALYESLKNDGYKIVNENLAENNNWLTNMVNSGFAQFATFSIESKKKVSTSVVTDTSLKEVSNKEFVKKAEATYEASMDKINKKESDIDNDLTTLETERKAIKNEQETVKNVIKNNVDLQFKLFS